MEGIGSVVDWRGDGEGDGYPFAFGFTPSIVVPSCDFVARNEFRGEVADVEPRSSFIGGRVDFSSLTSICSLASSARMASMSKRTP